MRGFIKTAMKLVRTPGLAENLSAFHNQLLLYLMHLAERSESETLPPHEADFLGHGTTYIKFLSGIGVPLETPDKVPQNRSDGA